MGAGCLSGSVSIWEGDLGLGGEMAVEYHDRLCKGIVETQEKQKECRGGLRRETGEFLRDA